MKIKTLDQIVSHLCPNVLTAVEDQANETVKVCDGFNVFDIEAKECELIGRIGFKSKYDLLKMYVVVDSEAPVGLGINGMVHVAYAAGALLTGGPAHNTNECIRSSNLTPEVLEMTKDWERASYRNVSVVGTSEDIQTAMESAHSAGIAVFEFYEPDWILANGRPLAVAFSPSYCWPEIFSKFELHSGTIRRQDRTPR